MNKRSISLAAVLLLTLGTLGKSAVAAPLPEQKNRQAAQKGTRAPLQHAVSLFGKPAYPEDFKHFNYVNPDAPKGGELRQSALGQFDSLNPYINRGIAAAGASYQYDTLLARSWDEPLTKYGLIAEKIEVDPNNQWVAFHVNPKARFNDGKPVTAEDIKFSFDILREKGSTFYRNFYIDVEEVTVTAPDRALFTFKHSNNRELVTNLGQMPIFPKHYWQDRDFTSPGLSIPVSSGPYKALEIKPSRSITWQRDPDYWAKDLPVCKGRFNFDRLFYTYYLDTSISLQGLLAGEYDWSMVSDPKYWQMLFIDKNSEKLLKKTKLVRETLPNSNPQTVMLTYNTRHAFLKDRRVREAISYAFDYDWLNKNYFHGMLRRADSYFSGTDLAASGLPSPQELKWLEPWRKQLPKAVFSQTYTAPGSTQKNARHQRAKSLALLKEAGWQVKDNQQVNDKGEPLTLTLLLTNPENERYTLGFRQGLKALGIELYIRTVDRAQYIERIRSLDFDIVTNVYRHTPSPGTEQKDHFGSNVADLHGTNNLAGIKNPAVDNIVNRIPTATSRKELLSLVHALDRILLWEHYSLPLWYQPDWPMVHRHYLKHPENTPPYALDLSVWWSEAGKP
ncbi:extracellular solute-binding protein [Endozoicomonas montiporae]|uniref:Microcin C transport system substrate-binding protein n=1 Tax=Endozoicomonas montiporae CL-33 TaxID=570277 RepID=A0A142BD41_9GAMM|nr:extracellular solute-binding protein [Endozoicomonas montiporae]AMO56667.1 microcin C transport system substrate-binding protein [Endozoicomonas montiporae CL-33]